MIRSLAATSLIGAVFLMAGALRVAEAQDAQQTPAEARLADQIKSSGNNSLVIYSAYPTFPAIVARFSKDHPEIRAVHQVASGATLEARLQAEKASGNHSIDVVLSGPVDMISLEQKGYFTPFLPVSASQLPANLKSASNGIGVPFRNLFSLTINTSLIPEANAPKNLDEVLDAKWKGRIGYATPTGVNAFDISTATLWYNKRITEAQLQKLHDLGTGIQTNTYVVTNVAQGRMVLGVWGPSQTAYKLQEDGAPVATKALEDITVMFGPGTALMASAANPPAGKLFLEWVYSPRGQKAFAEEMAAYGTMPGAPKPKGFPDIAFYNLKDIPIDKSVEVLQQYRAVTKKVWNN